jgi:hypothetical protein
LPAGSGVLPVESDIDISRTVFCVLTGPCSNLATRPTAGVRQKTTHGCRGRAG